MSKELTAERLRELLHYDRETGVFRWRGLTSRGRLPWSVAGTVARGYQRIHVEGKQWPSHRLAWLYVYGVWPRKYIDHIDGDGLNNRLSNLRECSHRENHQNVAPHADSVSGLLGVAWDKQTGRWRSRVMVDNRQHNLGRFDTPEAAHAAYLAAKKQLHTFNPVPRTTTTGTSANDSQFTAPSRACDR